MVGAVHAPRHSINRQDQLHRAARVPVSRIGYLAIASRADELWIVADTRRHSVKWATVAVGIRNLACA